MALTQQQQELADIAQAGEANACCLAMGNTIITNPITGEELCGTPGGMFGGETTNTFPLEEACGRIQASLPSQPSPGQQQSGFLTGLVDNLGEILGGIGSIVNPNPQPPTYSGGAQMGGGGNPAQVQPQQDNTVAYIIGGAVVLLLVFILIRKFK